jgi:hypothetical protein
MIPLLLTGAILFIATATLQWMVEPENPLSAPFAACPYLLIAAAALIGGLAVANMLSVRRQLTDSKRSR